MDYSYKNPSYIIHSRTAREENCLVPHQSRIADNLGTPVCQAVQQTARNRHITYNLLQTTRNVGAILLNLFKINE